MKRGLKLITVAIAMFIGLTMSSNAQLDAGSFGIGASFVSGSPVASGFYALSDNMELGVGLGYISESYDMDVEGFNAPDPGSQIYFNAMFKYFLSKGRDVSPFIGGLLDYSTVADIGDDNPKTTLGLGAMFGGQAQIAKNLHIYGFVSLGYKKESEDEQDVTHTYTTISLIGSGIGAIFYF
jgi:hypothetical protein